MRNIHRASELAAVSQVTAWPALGDSGREDQAPVISTYHGGANHLPERRGPRVQHMCPDKGHIIALARVNRYSNNSGVVTRPTGQRTITSDSETQLQRQQTVQQIQIQTRLQRRQQFVLLDILVSDGASIQHHSNALSPSQAHHRQSRARAAPKPAGASHSALACEAATTQAQELNQYETNLALSSAMDSSIPMCEGSSR